MNPEDIIPEIHRHRENLARACGYDVKKIMDHYRHREREHETKGHRLVSFVESAKAVEPSGVLREEPPKR